MKTAGKQFRDCSNAVHEFESMFRAGLQSLVKDLSDAPWFIRERDVVNRFVFRHLVPLFQENGWDINQIGIEIPVRVSPLSDKHRPGVYGDIVVWPHERATSWRRCKPLARIEWKHASCRERTLTGLLNARKEVEEQLMHNVRLAFRNYVVTTARHKGWVELCCLQIDDESSVSKFLEPDKLPAVGDEEPYKSPYPTIARHEPDCPECVL